MGTFVATSVATFLATLIASVAALGLYWQSLPPLDYARFAQRSTVVAAHDGTPLHVHLSADDKYRLITDIDSVSPRYIESLLTIEDQRFFRHPGVDPRALLRAAWQWLATGEIVSGGSTITMQVARLLEPKPRTFVSKITEILRALELESRHTKDEILSMYLTMVPMGSNVEGIRAGTSWIWGSTPEHLSLSQIAALIAIPQAPSDRSPFRNTGTLTEAQQRIAMTLVERGLFPAADLDELSLPRNIAGPFAFPKQAWHVSQRFKGTEDRITTTLDPLIQSDLESIAARYAENLARNLNVAAVVADAKTGEIRAHLGSLGIGSSSGFIDYTEAQRSPGSTLKPFVYGMAFDDGLITPESVVFDISRSFAGYRPDNFDRTHAGAIRAGDALIRSLNIPAVEVLDALGPETFISAWGHADLALTLPEPDSPMLGIVLGAATTSLTDLVAAYSAIAFDGTVIHPILTPSELGRRRRFLVSESTAATLRAILTNVRDTQRRTVSDAWRPHSTAFKTGTSVGFRDAWTLGTKGTYVIGVWVGTPSGAADPANTGRNHALTIASTVADALPAADAIVPWRPAPIQENKVPAQAPKLVYPSDGSRLVLLEAPAPARQLQVTLTGADAGMDLYLNDHPVEWSEDMLIPIPHDGFYDLEVRQGPVALEAVSFSVLSGG